MKKILLQSINHTEEQYEMLVFKNWMAYCEKNAKSEEDLQILLANSALCKWWRKELRKYEIEYVEEVLPYLSTITPDDALKLYMKNTIRMQMYFSGPLLQNARKHKNIISHDSRFE